MLSMGSFSRIAWINVVPSSVRAFISSISSTSWVISTSSGSFGMISLIGSDVPVVVQGQVYSIVREHSKRVQWVDSLARLDK